LGNRSKIVASIIILFFALSLISACLPSARAVVDTSTYQNSIWVLDLANSYDFPIAGDYHLFTNFLSAAHIGTVDVFIGYLNHDLTFSGGNPQLDIMSFYNDIKAALPNEKIVGWISNNIATNDYLDIGTSAKQQDILNLEIATINSYGLDGIANDVESVMVNNGTIYSLCDELEIFHNLGATMFHAADSTYFYGADTLYSYDGNFMSLYSSNIDEVRVQVYNGGDYFSSAFWTTHGAMDGIVPISTIMGNLDHMPAGVNWEIGIEDAVQADYTLLNANIPTLTHQPNGIALFRWGITDEQSTINFLATHFSPTPSPSPTAAPTPSPEPLVASPITLNDAILFLALFAFLALAYYTSEPFWFVISGFLCILTGIDLLLLSANNSVLWSLEFIGLVVIGVGCYLFANSLSIMLKTRKEKNKR
jgi:hypothetical protein